MGIRITAGKKLRVKIGSFTCPAGTGNYSVTGVGFKPRYVDFIVTKTTGSGLYSGTGWIDYNGAQRGMFIDMGGTPGIICYTPNFPIGALDIGVTWYLGANYVSMDADGFTVTFSYVDTTYTIHWKAVG